MSRKRRHFTAKFKSDLVLKLLKGEKNLHAIAIENSIQPNFLRNWKKEFLDKASVVFDDSREIVSSTVRKNHQLPNGIKQSLLIVVEAR